MKLAIFYPRNVYAGWYSLGGYVNTLRRMGHKVMDCALPGNQPHHVEELRQVLPTIADLNECHGVLSLYHEYTQPWLEALYGWDAWSELKAPVVARFDESVMERTDLQLPARITELLKWANYHSFPAAQDAERYDGQWLPYGADRMMFCPRWAVSRIYDLAFIGSMYPIRVNYLAALAEHLPNTITFRCGPAMVQDLSGIREPDSTMLLVENYRAIKVFFCLPPMSRLLVAKVFDVMACGTFLMYPRLPGEAAKNLAIFEDGKHLAYYDFGGVAKNAEQIKYWLAHDKEREAVARAGCQKVLGEHTLEQMCDALVGLVADRVLA